MNARREPDVVRWPAENERLLSLGDVIQILWKRLWIIALVTIIFLGATIGWTLMQTPVYEASTKILVTQKGASDVGTFTEVQGILLIVDTMAEAVSSRRVAESTVERLDLQITPEEVLGGLSAEPITDTQFIELSYVDTDPERAKQIANAAASAFSKQSIKLGLEESNIAVIVWEPAVTPEVPISPNPERNALLALMLGGMLGAGLALLLEYLDDSWQSPQEAEQISGVPTVGMIPAFDTPKSKEGRG